MCVTVTLASILLQQVVTINTGPHYDHPATNSGSHLSFVSHTQHQRLKRQSEAGGGSLVDNTLSTSIGTTTTTPAPPSSASSSDSSVKVNTRVDEDDEYFDGEDRHFDSDELNNRAIVPDGDTVDKNIKSQLADKKMNSTVGPSDSHKYYVGHFVADGKSWVDLDKLNQSLVKEHKMLSKSYRRAATVPLSFEFPFYGHNVTNITIATGGFLYTGDYVHAWLAATQYIAPLMANFDTSQNDQAKIRYADNSTALIVEWEKVHLKARDTVSGQSSEQFDGSPFSFQVVLHSNGDIVFAYKVIPLEITNIGDKEHPVKVGLSDAYIIDRTIFFVRRKTIYEYHRMDMKDHKIQNNSAIYFKALATCISKADCQSCIDTEVETEPDNQTSIFSTKHGKNLGCMWCPKIKRCSDGMDRLRQTWLRNSCEQLHHRKGEKECNVKLDTFPTGSGRRGGDYDGHNTVSDRHGGGDDGDFHGHGHDYSTLDSNSVHTQGKLKATSGHYQAGVVTTVALSLMLVLSCFVWFGYAYFFPHSWSGQLLIKYRPSHWQWRRAEPRYTAASIHM